MRRFVIAVLAAATLVQALPAAPKVILPTGQTVEGTEITADEQGTFYLTTAQGTLTFPAGTTVVVDKPEAYERAEALLERGQPGAAIPLLAEVIKAYRFLNWDRPAERLLADAQYGSGAYEDAVMTYEAVFVHSPPVAGDSGARANYLEALLQINAIDKLRPLLSETVATGKRDVAAKALMMRGRLLQAKGETGDALFDFMCVAELFRDMPDYQPEALYRTGKLLAGLGDGRSRDYFQRVIDDFANSSYAGKAKQEL